MTAVAGRGRDLPAQSPIDVPSARDVVRAGFKTAPIAVIFRLPVVVLVAALCGTGEARTIGGSGRLNQDQTPRGSWRGALHGKGAPGTRRRRIGARPRGARHDTALITSSLSQLRQTGHAARVPKHPHQSRKTEYLRSKRRDRGMRPLR